MPGVVLLLLVVSAALAVGAEGADRDAAAASGLRVTMRAPTHRPKAGRRWPVRFTASYRGRRTRVRLRYEFLYGGRVVSRQNPGPLRRSGYRFTGHFTDREFVWPARAAGYRLTFRAVLSNRYGTRRLSYWIRVRR